MNITSCTGHEMLPQFALINMNGRMYDPVIGKMLAPDNHIPNPYSAVGYNRYDYAFNNPLTYTDPTGETFASWYDVERTIEMLEEGGGIGGYATGPDDIHYFTSDDDIDAYNAGINAYNGMRKKAMAVLRSISCMLPAADKCRGTMV